MGHGALVVDSVNFLANKQGVFEQSLEHARVHGRFVAVDGGAVFVVRNGIRLVVGLNNLALVWFALNHIGHFIGDNNALEGNGNVIPKIANMQIGYDGAVLLLVEIHSVIGEKIEINEKSINIRSGGCRGNEEPWRNLNVLVQVK